MEQYSKYSEVALHQRVPGAVSPGSGAGQAATVGLGPEALQRLAGLGLTSACLAHDMGNLLQVISGALHLIEREAPSAEPADTRVLFQSARRAVERISALRGQILDCARVQPAALRRVDAGGVIASLRSLLELTLGPDIRLEIVLADHAPSLFCDPQELENVIFNLVANARDAMADGGRVTVTLERAHEAAGAVGGMTADAFALILKVGDTGCGMTGDDMARVFTPFFTTKSAERGAGLGLAAVSEFARTAGGSVEIESELGAGTTVILRLPGMRDD